VRVLLIDDDHELARLLREYFTPHDVELAHEADGDAGIVRTHAGDIDVVLLDVMLPGKDGFEVCRALRRTSDVPIIMLTARGDDTDRIVGLELGADDYVPKPYNPRELLARIRAVLRRTRQTGHASAAAASDEITVGGLVIDVPAHRVTVDGDEVQLTAFELRLLIALARRAGETVPREELSTLVTGDKYDPSVDRSLDVHVSHLRQKIEKDPRAPKRIKTVRGVGYALVRPGRPGTPRPPDEDV
jgi:DNA-binding response OmpR family regulator